MTILNMSDFLGRFDNDVIAFVTRIFPLRELPSTDPRFKTALEDFTQHTVNNFDWSNSYIFNERLNIVDRDEDFSKFVELVVSPEVRISKDSILEYIAIINNALAEAGLKLVLTDYFEGLPVYKLREQNVSSDLPIDIAENRIPFFKRLETGITEFPCFTFGYDNWDDYGFKTSLDLYYHPSPGASIQIGRAKLLKTGATETWPALPLSFTVLSNEWCSLGQTEGYYLDIKATLGTNYQSVLMALRDAAIFPRIHEQFENVSGFATSLLRSNTAEQLLRTIRFKLNGLNEENQFTFTYSFRPPYS
ncbi:MAG TPA: hypothetical protein VEA37_04155, partial [Flavobacterium sp.]|nr:hypothetical protein [Flavobacterium sp.]